MKTKTATGLTFSEFIDLINLLFKLYGRSYAQKMFEKYKHKYYNVDTDDCIINLSYIKTPIED